MAFDSEQPMVIRLRTAAMIWVILCLAQLLISTWTVHVAEQRDIIDFVSFSGTLTSMLLAFLAIVYSYYTTASQKSDADRIATQIGTLTNTVQSLHGSEARLSGELERLSEIREMLGDVSTRVSESGEQTKDLRRVLEEVRAGQELASREAAVSANRQAQEEAAGDGGDEDTAAKKYVAGSLAKSAADEQLITMYAAYVNTVQETRILELMKIDVEPYMLEEQRSNIRSATTYGEIFGYTMIFIDLNFAAVPEVAKAFASSFAERIEEVDETTFKPRNYDGIKLARFLKTKIPDLREAAA